MARVREASLEVGVAALLLLSSCATPEQDDDVWESGALIERERAIGWLDGDPVTYGDLARFLRARDALSFSRTLDGLIVDRITRAEAERGKVDVPVAIVERRTSARYLGFERRLRAATKEQTGAEIDPRLWLRRTLGLTPEQFRLYLRRQIEVELLQDRLIRYAEFRVRSVEISLIVVPDAEVARTARRRVAEGEPFALVAKEVSRHATAKTGGRVEHRMIANDFEDRISAQAVMQASRGEVVGPFETEGDGRAFFRIYRIEETRDAQDVPFAEIAGSIEADLEKRPVSVGEYIHWRRRMQELHGFLPSANGSDPR